MGTCVDTLCNVDQTHLALETPHVGFSNEFVVVIRGTLSCWHLGLVKLVHVGCVRTVTLLTEGKVVTLLAVKPEMTFLDRL